MRSALFFLFITSWYLGNAQISENATEIFNRAQELHRPVLLVFSGSDWCPNCMRLKKEILNDPAFLDYAKDNMLLLNADFPQRKELSDKTIQQNEALADKYNPGGAFPHLVLLEPDQSLMATITYSKQSAEALLDQLKLFIDIPVAPLKEYKRRIPAMGSFFEFIIVDAYNREAQAWNIINDCIAEVVRIENLISEWQNESEVSRINENAGIAPVQVPAELYSLIERSIKMGDLTQGAFDITFQGLGQLWRFDGSQAEPPDSSKIALALKLIDYRKIQLLDSNKVYLPEEGMAISFGGIGQGYAVDKIKDMLLEEGIENFVVNSSGDIFAHGNKADGSPWKIGIANPFDKNEIIRWLELDNRAVVTSGDYEKYFEYQGVRYAHIIDPKTGWPTKGIVSCSVISSHTEIADALATSIFVLGKEVGLDLIDQLPNTHCIIIDEDQSIFYSKELKPRK